MSYQTRIQVLIKEQTPYGEFNDALYFTQEEYATKTEDDINTIKQERVNNFISAVSNPPKEDELTLEDLQAQKKSLLSQANEIDVKINEIDNAQQLVEKGK